MNLEAPAELTKEGTEPRSSRILGAAISTVLLITIFALPLFFTTLTSDAINLPKQLFLLVAMTLVGVMWIARVFLTKTVVLRKSFLYFPAVLYLGAVAVSTIVSVDRYTSFFGGSLGEYASLVTLMGFLMMLFFITTHEADLVFVRRAVTVFFVSGFVVQLVSLIKLFGVSVPSLPVDAIWNPIGSPYALGIFATFVVLLAGGMLLFDREHQAVFLPGKSAFVLRLTAVLAGLSGLLYLMVIDWSVAWIVMIVGSGLLLVFVFVYASAFRNVAHLVLPLLTFVLSLLFIFIKTPLVARVPIEVSPSQGASLEIAQETLRESPAFGSGPATYFADFARYRSSSLNQSVLWSVRFDRAASFALTTLATLGIAGALLWLLLVMMTMGLVVRSFVRERDPVVWLLTTALFFPWLALVVSRFLYHSTMALEFQFWFATALLMIAMSRSARRATFTSSPRVLLGTSFAAVVFAVLMVIVLLVGVTRFTAAVIFARAVHASGVPGVDLENVASSIARATAFDPRTDVYWRNLSQVALLRAGQASNVEELRPRLDAAVNAARRATLVSPVNAQNWVMLGNVYEQMTGPVRGAGELAIQAFEKSGELDPKNPLYFTEIAKVHLALVDALRAGKDQGKGAEAEIADRLTDALDALGDALTLKTDYAPAHFYTAATLERQGKLRDAVKKMETVVQANPRDVGAMFQLSLLYLKNNETDRAENQLKRAVQLAPNYANAHWYLAAIYERRGAIADAVKEIEAVLTSNPDNQSIKDRLAQLKSGRQPVAPFPVPLDESARRSLGQ